MPKFVDISTNPPPVDPSLVKRNIVSGPKFVDVTPPKFVDTSQPKKAPVDLLAEKIEADLNFQPTDDQLDEYFVWKDKQPFDLKKTWDASVNAVGMALSDIAGAVEAGVTDPEFYKIYSPRRTATLGEAFARGSWDLSILGKMMANKFKELAVEPSWREKANFLVEKHNEEYPDKPITWQTVFHQGYDEVSPGDRERYLSDWENELRDNRRERWREMRYILNTRNLAREGKKTIIGEFLGEEADKLLLPRINQKVAEGGSYFLDPSLPVGLAATPLKAGQKSLLTRKLIAPTIEKTGKATKWTGKKAEGLAKIVSDSIESLQKQLAGDIEIPPPRQVSNLQMVAKPLTIAGEGIEAIGRVIGKPEGLESTLQRATRIAESEPARKALKVATKYLDPAIAIVDNLATGAIEGGKAGGVLALPSGEEEFIGGAIGTGATMGGFGGVAGGFVGDKSRTAKQAENTVADWLNSKTEDERDRIKKLNLTPVEAANVAVAETLGRGIIGDKKISDMNFVYMSQPEYLAKFHPEVLVDGVPPLVTPTGTRGAQSSVDNTPTVFINTGYDGPRSIFHEMMHAMLKFDELGDKRAELRGVLFDQKAGDGTVLKRGMYSDDDIDVFFDQYLSRLPDESRAVWEEQFKVYDEADPSKVDQEATREAERQYIMEEIEAESFANFIKESGPTFMRQARSIRQRLVDNYLFQDHLKKTRVLRSVLEKSGVPFGADGNPVGVFWKDGKPISNNRELNKIMRDFVRAKDSVVSRMMEDEGRGKPSLSIGATRAAEGRKKVEAALKSKDGRLLVEHFKTNDIFKRNSDGTVAYDVAGMPILLGEREIKKLQEKRAVEIQKALQETGVEPGGMLVNENGSWSGIPTDAQVAKILQIPNDIIPPGMKEAIVDIVEKFRTPGQSIVLDYNPALGKSKRYSSNLSSGIRIAVPLGFHVSKSQNFYMTTLDLGAMNMKLSDWGNPESKTHKNLKMWDGDAKRFQQDIFKYLENHKADRPGETGLDANASTAEAKRDIINDFFNVAEKDANPITEARKATKRTGKARQVENLLRTRRFDRINRIEKNRVTKYGAGTPLPMKTQAEAYRKWKKNLMPGDEARYMPGEPARPPVDDLGFYSRVAEVAASDKIPARATGEQMLATIAKQPGVKKEEIAWLGLEEFLRGKDRVTKDELGDFIRENDVRLEETVFGADGVGDEGGYYSDSSDWGSEPVEFSNYAEAEQFAMDLFDLTRLEAFDFVREAQTERPSTESFTKYGEYQLPGAEPGSYREMVLRLPTERQKSRVIEGDDGLFYIEHSDGSRSSHGIDSRQAAERELTAYVERESTGEYHRKDPSNYQSTHWNEPNVLAHVRFNDRTGPNGEKILFVEEVQSDWHREGRERGYARQLINELPPGYYAFQKNDGTWAITHPSSPTRTEVAVGSNKAEAISNAINRYNELRRKEQLEKVPDAPFKTSWHELAMKRMLRHAAENGYDKLAWISGEETAKRYDLSTKVGKLVVSKSDETGKIALDADGELVDSSIDPKKLESYVGKEVAKRALDLLENESPDMGGNKSVELTGDDLQVGGQWAYNLYDRMIPQFMKKYGKKWGAKVEDAEISLGDPGELKMTGVEVEPTNFKSIDITPAMRGDERGSVVGGQVKFMPGVEPVTYRGREVADWSPEDFADFGKQFGVDNFGPQSKIMPVADQDGKSVNLPGGLDGEFTFYDLLWLKANPIDPSTLSKSLTSKLQQKLVRSVTPEPGDRVEVFNRFLFGMLSPNQPLTPNEFEFAAMRVRTPDDIDKLASFIDWEPGEKVDKSRRKAAEQQMTEFYETQASGAGGMGLKGSADYTNLAEFAKLYKKDPDFFTKKPDESWDQFVEKVMTQARGLSAKVASFSVVWQDPVHAAISAIDRHMARNFLPKLFPTKKSRQQFERSVVKRWNSLVDARRKLDSKFQKTVTKYNRTKASNRSDELKAEYKKYKDELLKLPKAPKSELKKIRNMDEVFRVQGGDAVFMDRVMSVLSSNERKFEVRGERNPMVPDYLHDVDWINRPDKASVIGDAYRQALAENDRRAQQSGLHLFASQWHLWDRIRRRLEPHEVMFPGLHKIPKMNRSQLEKAMNVHKEAGYWSSVKEPYREPTTGEVEMRMKPTRPMPGGPASAAYFMPATPGPRTPTQITPTSEPVNLVMDKIYRLPEEEKEERKDRAIQILEKFSKP